MARDDIYSLYRGRFYVWGPRLCSLYRGFRYIEVRYIEVLFHAFYCNFGRAEEYRSLYQGLRYVNDSSSSRRLSDVDNRARGVGERGRREEYTHELALLAISLFLHDRAP